MKILVISDSHGNLSNIHHVMGFAKKIKAGAVIHAADWDNIESVNSVLNFNIPTYSVLGNADIDPNIERVLRQRCQKFSKDNIIFKIDNKTVGVIHSFKSTENWYKNCDVVFCGHRHSPEEKIVKGVKVIRPGALVVGIFFVIYDTKNGEVEFMKL